MSPQILLTLLILSLIPTLHAQSPSPSSDECRPGYFLSQTPTTPACLQCPPGTYQNEYNQTGCKPCLGRTIAPNSAATLCLPCPSTQVPSFFRNLCECPPGTVNTARRNDCQPCPPGYRVTTAANNTRCSACPAGTYQPDAGQVECLSCPPKSFSDIAATKCLVCPPGLVPLTESSCGLCPPGQTFSYPRCENCRAGQYKAQPGQQPCLPCPMNGFSREGSDECIVCPHDLAPMANGTCTSCAPGMYYDEEEAMCRFCRPGEFQPMPNSRKDCYHCASNAYSAEGSASCTVCPPGKALMGDGSCQPCKPGYSYSDERMECVKCPPGKYSHGTVDFFCEECPKRTFSLFGSTTCQVCAEGFALLRDGKCGNCAPGTYFNKRYATCSPCYDETITEEANVSASCIACPVGTRANIDKTACM